MQIRWRKIYQKAKEGDLSTAIITFMNAPSYTKGGRYIAYRNALRIDLWVVVIQFEWESWSDEK